MKKNTWIILGVITVVAVLGGLFATGMFSVAGFGGRLGYRIDEYPCDRTNTWQVDDYKITYTTISRRATLLDKDDTDFDDTCVPANVKYYENNQLLFEFDDNGGIVTNTIGLERTDDTPISELTGQNVYYYTPDGKIGFKADRGRDGEVYPDNIVEDIEVYFEYGVGEFDLKGTGWDRYGNNRGSKMTFNFYGRRVNFTIDFMKDQDEVLNGGEPLVATITNNQDFKFGAKVCREYGVDGLFGKVNEIDCEDSITMFEDRESKQVSYNLPSPNETDLKEYEVRVVLKDAFVRFDNIDPAYGDHADFDESYLRNGNEFLIGTARTQWEPVSLIAEYQEEIDRLEGNLTAQLDYIDSLETDYETKAGLVQDLNMEVSQLRDAIEQYEASQEQKEETIKEYEEDLQQSETINYILYGVIGVLIIVAGIVGYNIRRK